MLLDIHSFPKGSFDGSQIAIIDIYKTHRPKLYEFALYIKEKTNIDIKVYDGADNNIQNSYQTSTYPMLLEFCEDREFLLDESINMFLKLLLDYFNF